MKKITLFAALSALVFVSCNKDENSLIKMSNHTITASMETDAPETRTAFKQDGALYWIAGDDIAVYSTNGNFNKYTLTEGAGTADATFTSVARIGSNSTYALHPYSEGHKYEDSELTFNLPVEYEYTEKSDDYGTAPMIAVTEEVDASSYSFKHLGGAFCFTIKNLPVGVTYFKFEADEQITGDFIVKEVDRYHVISLPEAQPAADASYDVTINFPAEESVNDKRFFIPLPEGTIDGFRISIGTSEGETWAYTSTKSNTITRTELVAMPAVTLNATVDGTVATEVSTPEQLKAAFTNGGKYRLTTELTLTEQLTFNNVDKPLTIDLGNNTLTLGTSSYGIVNKAGTLTIKNGTISSSNSYAALSNYSTSDANIETVLNDVNITASYIAVYNKGVWEDYMTVQKYKNTDAAVKFTMEGGTITSTTNELNPNIYAVRSIDYSMTEIKNASIVGEQTAGGIELNCAQAKLDNVVITRGTEGTAHQVFVLAGILDYTNTTINNYRYYYGDSKGKYGYAEVNGTYYGEVNTAIPVIDTEEALTAALTNGESVVLTVDIKLSEQLNVASNTSVVVDLNGKTLIFETATNAEPNYGIVNAGQLTIKNGYIDDIANNTTIYNSGQLKLYGVDLTTPYIAVYNKGVWEDDMTVQKYKNTDAAVKFTMEGGTITSTTNEPNPNIYAVRSIDYSMTEIKNASIVGEQTAGGIELNCAQAKLDNVVITRGTEGTAHQAFVLAGILDYTNTTINNYRYYYGDSKGKYGYAEVNGVYYGEVNTVVDAEDAK